MISMDNRSHNGDKLYAAIHAFAEKWTGTRRRTQTLKRILKIKKKCLSHGS